MITILRVPPLLCSYVVVLRSNFLIYESYQVVNQNATFSHGTTKLPSHRCLTGDVEPSLPGLEVLRSYYKATSR